jgi:hypothetical protein
LKERFDSAVVDVVDQCNRNRKAGTKQDRITANSGSTRNSKEYQRNVRTGDAVHYVAQTALANGGKIDHIGLYVDIMGTSQKVMANIITTQSDAIKALED